MSVRHLLTGAGAAAILVAAGAAQAQMYKCVDARGVTRYTDTPQPDCKAREVDIRPQPPISGSLRKERETDVGRAERDFRKRQIARERKEAAEAKSQAAKKRKCESLRAQEYRARTARRVYGIDARGKYGPLDDADRARRVAELEREAASACR